MWNIMGGLSNSSNVVAGAKPDKGGWFSNNISNLCSNSAHNGMHNASDLMKTTGRTTKDKRFRKTTLQINTWKVHIMSN